MYTAPSVGLALCLLCTIQAALAAADPGEPLDEIASDNGPWAGFYPAQSSPVGGVAIAWERSRQWTDCQGNTVSAQLTGCQGAVVFLLVDDESRAIAFPLAGFSEADRAYVRERLEASGKGEYFPGAADPNSETAKLRQLEGQWRTLVNQWSRTVLAGRPESPQETEEAWQHLRSVRDPNATGPLVELANRKRSGVAVRSACIESLAAIGGEQAIRTLVKLACTDPENAIRSNATWALCNVEHPATVLAEHTIYLRHQQFQIPALISLHATGLVRPRAPYDPLDPELVDALLGVLILELPQKTQVPLVGYVVGGHGSTGTRGMHWIYGRVTTSKTIRFNLFVPCEVARRMLVQHSGTDYGYDERQWRQWQRESAPQR